MALNFSAIYNGIAAVNEKVTPDKKAEADRVLEMLRVQKDMIVEESDAMGVDVGEMMTFINIMREYERVSGIKVTPN